MTPPHELPCPACGAVAVVMLIAGIYDETHEEWNPEEHECTACGRRYYGDPDDWPKE